MSNSMKLPEIDHVLERFRNHLATRQPDDQPSIAFLLSKESLAWQLRFEITRKGYDISKAIEKSDAALQHLREDESNAPASDRVAVYESAGNAQYFYFTVTGRLDAINTAIENCNIAMNSVEVGSRRWWSLAANKLAVYLLDRLDLFPTEQYISHAVEFFGSHAKTEGLDALGLARFLSKYSTVLARQYLVTREIRLLEEALNVGDEAIDLLPDPRSATIEYTNHANNLNLYFQQTQQFSAIEKAIRISKLSIEYEASRGLAEEAAMLVNYGNLLVSKYKRYVDTHQIDAEEASAESIEVGRKAVRILEPIRSSDQVLIRHQKSKALTIISAWFAFRAKMTQDLKYGEEGVDLLSRASGLIEDDHSEQILILANLSHVLEIQHQVLKSQGKKQEALEKLTQALEYCKVVAEATPVTDPAHGERYTNLGKMHLSKLQLTEDENADELENDVRTADRYFCYVANLASAPLVFRIQAAIQAANIHLRAKEVAEAHKLLQMAISLLPVFHPQMLSPEDLLATVKEISGLSTLATSVALEAGRSAFEALQFLEAGRCIISGLSMSLKGDIIRLRQKDEKLAEDYETLRKKLANTGRRLPPNPSPLATPQTEPQSQLIEAQQQELLDELTAMEGEIRKIKGLELFQLPPSEEVVHELASEGPLIAINVSHLRSDAIIVTTERIRAIELTALKLKDLEEKIDVFQQFGNEARSAVSTADSSQKPKLEADSGSDLKAVDTSLGLDSDDERNAIPVRKKNPEMKGAKALRWLWDVAVRPILDDLEADFVSYSSRRIWWITSGLAGRAPLHAAGSHDDGSVENTLSRAISSYVSSIKALQYGMENTDDAASSFADDANGRMLLVTMAKNPPPYHNLNTKHEETAIKNAFGPEWVVHLEQPDPELVLKHIPDHTFVHFACHGASVSRDPFESGLLLVKGGNVAMLTVAQLEEANTKQGAIAYLSACSTAEQPGGKLVDEAIHLANTFQALGFQHVIGTMWGANDKAAGEIAKRFYTKLTAEEFQGSVAEALHEAMLEYRKLNPGEGKWGPFIHIGV